MGGGEKNTLISLDLIFIWIILAFATCSFWEAYSEGENVGASKQCGWVIKIGKYQIKAYHFWLWYISVPMFLILPLFINFSKELLGTILACFFIGSVIQDFFWYVINPKFSFKDFNARKVTAWPWFLGLPYFYWLDFVGAFLSWWFLIR